MARRKNPLFDPVSREIEAAISGSMIVVDQWFDEVERLQAELATTTELRGEIQARILRRKKEGWTSAEMKSDADILKDATSRISNLQRETKIIDRRIAAYYKASFKDIEDRLDTIRVLPGSSMYAREYRDALRILMLAKKQAQFANVDVRPKITQLRGVIKTLEDATSSAMPTGIEVHTAGSRGRLKPKKIPRASQGEKYRDLINRWQSLRARAIGYKTEVEDIDLLFKILSRRAARGEPEQDKNLKNLEEQMNILSSKIGERVRRVAEHPDAVRAKLGRLRRDLVIMRKRTRRSPKDAENLHARLEEIRESVGVKMTKDWPHRERADVLGSIRDSEALLASMESVSLPSRLAMRMGIEPTRKHRIQAKAISKRSGNPRKKSANNKAAKRAITPDWQRLTRRCQKLWDHYCERPGRARLQSVIKHLETMKGSTSGKVLDERKRCLHAVNAEAKRLKLKK